MVSELGELIARYEAAQERVMEVVKSRPDSDAELMSADQDLTAAFNAVLDHHPISQMESIQRVRFLLDQIKSNQPGNELVEKLANRVWLDLVECDGIPALDFVVQSEQFAKQN